MTRSSSSATVFQADDAPTKLRDAYKRDGFVVVDGIFDPSHQETDVSSLKEAAADVIALTRAGNWPFRRVVGKQFPPFDSSIQDFWGTQHLMHPDLPHHELFARFYANRRLLRICAELMETEPEDMQLELFNLLINPEQHAFALGWHRDDIRPSVTAEEEESMLAKPLYGVQWNACLYDDACLFVVPGTHGRVRTTDEKQANLASPPPPTRVEDAQGEAAGKQIDGSWDVDPPTTLRVELKAGQTAFYSQRILHRASYLPTKTRATLHGCYGCVSSGQKPDTQVHSGTEMSVAAAERARNVLQHGVEWMREERFGNSLPENLKPMWQNLLKMERAFAGSDLGFSLEG